MADLGKAYVQIIPSAEGIAGKIQKAIGSEADEAGKKSGESSGESFGKKFASAAKAIIAAAGIGKFISAALDEGGKLQQSFIGGLDTLYGEAADAAREYATAAAQAGISANDYAEQAVSFGAALKSAFGGDVKKAAEAANTAIMDMADNSAKMGTDIGSVQAAYQGFAKQNYTMLDNLKLGYGGTKSEMERLLARANELNAQQGKITNYSIDNLGDVYDAIHVVQEDLGLTGVAAEEAASTLSGSFGAVRAAFQNTIGNMALGEDITSSLQVLTNSISNWLFGNLLPMVGNVASSIPQIIVGAVQGIAMYADEIVNSGINLVTDLVQGIITAVPQLLIAISDLAVGMYETITSIDWGIVAGEIFGDFDLGILDRVPEIINTVTVMITNMLQKLFDALPSFMQKGAEFIINLINGIGQKLPSIILAIGNLMNAVITKIMQNLPALFIKGTEIIGSMISGIGKQLPSIVSAIFNVISQLLATIMHNMPQFLAKGIELSAKVACGIVQAIPQVLSAMGTMALDAMSVFSKVNWASLGKNIIDGIVAGLKRAGNLIKDTLMGFAKRAFDGVKKFFGIASPSKLMRDEIGRNLPKGVAVGIEKDADYVQNAMADLAITALDVPLEPNINTSLAMDTSTPLQKHTTNYGGVTININAADYNNAQEIAAQVKKILTEEVIRQEAVFA